MSVIDRRVPKHNANTACSGDINPHVVECSYEMNPVDAEGCKRRVGDSTWHSPSVEPCPEALPRLLGREVTYTHEPFCFDIGVGRDWACRPGDLHQMTVCV